MSPREDRVAPRDLPRRERGAKHPVRPVSLRHEQQPRRLLVQPVDDPFAPWSAPAESAPPLPFERVYKGSGPIPRRRMDDHSGGLVDDHDIARPRYDDVERNLLRRRPSAQRRRHLDRTMFADARPVAGLFAPAPTYAPSRSRGRLIAQVKVATHWFARHLGGRQRVASSVEQPSRRARRRQRASRRCGSGQTLFPRRLSPRVRASRDPPPEHPRQQHRADRHRGIGDIERPEPHVADADVDEVDDAARRRKRSMRFPAAPPQASPSASTRAKLRDELVPGSCQLRYSRHR